MKNIHILPTDKPSRLFENSNGDLILSNVDYAYLSRINRAIYITSDEEIKEGDWRFDIELNRVEKGKETGIFKNWKKIILTTDQDLIKDGVQTIDDEFLEWFVKNPNCEKVEVKCYSKFNDGDFSDYKIFEDKLRHSNKIIIPKEEPKQETLEEAVNKFKKTDVYINEIKQAQERSCNEEEVKHLMTLAFEQGFKKADIVEAGLEAKETDIEVNWIFLKHKK